MTAFLNVQVCLPEPKTPPILLCSRDQHPVTSSSFGFPEDENEYFPAKLNGRNCGHPLRAPAPSFRT